MDLLLTAYPSGKLIWEILEAGDSRYRMDFIRETVINLWAKLSRLRYMIMARSMKRRVTVNHCVLTSYSSGGFFPHDTVSEGTSFDDVNDLAMAA